MEINNTEPLFYSESISDLEMSLQVSEAEEKSASKRLVGPENNLKFAELVKSDMAIVDKYQEEIISLEKQLDDVEGKLPASGNSTEGLWNWSQTGSYMKLIIQKSNKHLHTFILCECKRFEAILCILFVKFARNANVLWCSQYFWIFSVVLLILRNHLEKGSCKTS